MLIELDPRLAAYSTFARLHTPLHSAAAKGHAEIVALLLDNGADVNSRNLFGQTALMQACRHGHWEAVQTLLLYRPDVTKSEYMTRKTALHFAVEHGHLRCIRLLVADFIPSTPYIPPLLYRSKSKEKGGCCAKDPSPSDCDKLDLARFVNKTGNGGVTALHIASLKGQFDCVQLLLDLEANVSAVTSPYIGSAMNMIGAGSTPLHFAAYAGNFKCCQILIARGASRLTLNCNGWLPVHVARISGRHWLESLLSPNSDAIVPIFPPSGYLSLPLLSILNIARETGFHTSIPSDDSDHCAVCLERECGVAAEGCAHELCVKCALNLCSTTKITSKMAGLPGSIPCPLCRNGIVSFTRSRSSSQQISSS